MRFRELYEKLNLPKYQWVKFDDSDSDIRSMIKKINRDFPDVKVGKHGHFLHVNGADVYDLRIKPLDYNAVTAAVKRKVAE